MGRPTGTAAVLTGAAGPPDAVSIHGIFDHSCPSISTLLSIALFARSLRHGMEGAKLARTRGRGRHDG